MASNSKQTEGIRKRKAKANKTNLKQEEKRLANNYELLAKLERAAKAK